MMKQFERDLREIQNKNTKRNIVSHEDLTIPLERLDYLKAQGLITITPLYDNLLRVTITDEGITYFDNKQESKKLWIMDSSKDAIIAILAALIGVAFGHWVL